MYIEKRKNAWFLKSSQWDKEAKRVKSSSTYLGSDVITAKATLRNHINDSCAIQKLSDKIDELDRPKPGEILSDAIAFLDKSETLAGLSGYEKLAEAIMQAKLVLVSHKRNK